MTELVTTDVAIIGAGPVGMFMAFECGMLRMKTVLIDALEAPGGQCAALYPEKPIYDIPGHPEIAAATLVEQLEAQIAPFAPPILLGRRVEQLSGAVGDFRLTTDRGEAIAAKAVVIAAGAGAFGPNRPPLAGLEAYEASLCVRYALRRKEEMRGKRVVIAGGGDSAVDWALSLAGIAAHIYVVHRRARFRAAPESVARMDALVQAGAVEMVTPFQLHGLHGADGQLQAVEVADLDGRTRLLPADILLPFFGLSMDLGPISNWGLALERHHLVVDPSDCQTNLPGVFGIGDVVTYKGKLKLILQGFSEAAMAAHAIHPIIYPDQPLHFEYSTTSGVPV